MFGNIHCETTVQDYTVHCAEMTEATFTCIELIFRSSMTSPPPTTNYNLVSNDLISQYGSERYGMT